MLVKKRVPSNGHVRVTFQLQDLKADAVELRGDFSGWGEAGKMRRDRDGNWRVTLTLESGRSYDFRYLVDDVTWINDPAADRYVPNPFGSENSVVTT